MAEFLAVVGGMSASLQLLQAAAEGLLATMKLVQDLRRVPKKLATVLKDINSSTRGLSHLCSVVLHPDYNVFQQLSDSQLRRLTSAAAAVVSVMAEINSLLTPLVGNGVYGQGSRPRQSKLHINTVRRLLKSIMSLTIESDICEKLARLGRLNLEMLRELNMIGLEIQASTKALVVSLSSEIRGLGTNIAQRHATSTTLALRNSGLHDHANQRLPDRRSQDQKKAEGAALLATLELLQRRLFNLQERSSLAGDRLKNMMASRAEDTVLDFVLFSIRTFYTPGNFTFSPSTLKSDFWQDTSSGIYLVKVSDQEQGQVLMQKSRTEQNVRGIFTEAATVSLIEILSTLSPTNTAVCPRIREDYLHFLSILATQQLASEHPVVKIIQRLRSDNGNKDLSLRALLAIVQRLQSTLGPAHDLSLFALNRLVALLRRGGDFTEASRICKDAMTIIKEGLGPESLQERRVGRQLEHIYMDEGDWSGALGACFNIVGQQQVDNGTPDPRLHDECAVYTMEDIAKIYECTGMPDHSIAWLKQAVVSGGMIWGPGHKLGHVQDKLDESLRRCGRVDEAQLWRSSLQPEEQ
ncbi:unnamed protein product [Discula destructiva]